MFSAVTSAFIVQIIPELRPDPTDLTNVLLLRILLQNASFDGVDPLTAVSNVPAGVVRAQSILFASLSVTLLAAFIAVLGKLWVTHYTRLTAWGNIVDRGKERQAKIVRFQKWGFHILIEALPVMLQFALLLFGIALAVYLWDWDHSSAEVVLAVTSVGFAFYVCITVAATLYSDCPFQTPLSILLPKTLAWVKEFYALVRVGVRRKVRSFRLQVKRVMRHGFLRICLEHVLRTSIDGTTTLDHAEQHTLNNMTLSNPALWRSVPLFTSPIPKEIGASAGFWLLDNSTDSSAASAFAAVFPELQWPSHYRSTTALIQLRDAYRDCFRAPGSGGSTHLKALQSAAAYYVLYHTQLIWSASIRLKTEITKFPSNLPPDLFLHLHDDKWGGNDLFEYLLRIEERSEPVMSVRFLSYIAPYWFCGDSDSAIRFRPSRLETLHELIGVLEDHKALNHITLTDCLLCVGAAMDFPLHPEDLIRIDKRCVPPACTLTAALMGDSGYLVRTFEMVVEYIHCIILTRGRRHRHTKKALEILVTIVKKSQLRIVNPKWITGLLESAASGNMSNDQFTLLLRLRALGRKEDVPTESSFGQDSAQIQMGEAEPPSPRGTTTPEYNFFLAILRSVRACGEEADGWEDDAVYGGLIAMRDIPGLGSFPPDPDSNPLGTLYEAMEKGKLFHVRIAAYEVIVVARDGWLRSRELRRLTLENPPLRVPLRDTRLDFPRQLYSVVIQTRRPDYQRSFLAMMGILSVDENWHPYLRQTMDIWLPFRHEGPNQVLGILSRVGGLSPPFPEYDLIDPPLDEFLEKLVENEWAGIPGRIVEDLTVDRLRSLAEITKHFKDLLFTEVGRRAVLAVVEEVIPGLQRRREGGYEESGEDIYGIIGDLLETLRVSQ